MGIGGFLASQAERDHYRYLRRTTQARVKRSCDGEVEREVHAVLGPVGVDQNVSRQVAHSLLEVESGMDQTNGQASAPPSTDAEQGLKWSQSVGVTKFLIRFGEGHGARLCFVVFYVDLRLLFLFRGSPNTPSLPLRIYDWDGLSHRWRDPINSLLFHPDCTHRAHLLVHLNRYRSTRIWCCQGEGYWCSKQGSQWICLGRCKYIGGRRCGGSGCICHS